MFDYQEYRNRSSQHILFYEAGVDDRQRVYEARVAVIDLGGIAIESSRLRAIAQMQLLRFLHWGTAADDDLSGVAAGNEQCLPRGMAAVRGAS
ncbi:MAG: hypothetical protein ACLPXM_08075 [Terriglobales bacterium]